MSVRPPINYYTMNIQSTVYPDQPLTEVEWMKEFRVSIQVTKSPEGVDRARWLMSQWQEGKAEFIFQDIADIITSKL